MTGKELSESLIASHDQGAKGDDPIVVEALTKGISELDPEETWRFVFAMGAAGRGDPSRTTFLTALNGAVAGRDEFKAAIHAMYAVPKPAGL